jgi:hypothetical protein
MPHAKVFEQSGIPLTLRVSTSFLQYFLAKLDCFIDLRLGQVKRVKKLCTKERGNDSNGL